MEVLLVEDDPLIGKSLQKGLQEAGNNCVWVKDGEAGLEEAISQKFELIVLDLMLPGMTGLQVLDEVRKKGIQTPVIALTALGTVEERVAGLQKGADDYVVKPFSLPELLARIDAVSRRAGTKPSPMLKVAGLELDLAKRRVIVDGHEVELTPTEFSLLEYLMRFEGQVVTRKMLCEHLWESDWEGVTNVIEVHINRLRGKIDRGRDNSFIQTVRGRGYAIRAS
ncbi:MAG: response regulator transcription factor [Planctomycetaceae bacterium]|nr:response regulator transcription factor [Planctomycetaceae bacterium]